MNTKPKKWNHYSFYCATEIKKNSNKKKFTISIDYSISNTNRIDECCPSARQQILCALHGCLWNEINTKTISNLLIIISVRLILTMPLSTTSWSSVNTMIMFDGMVCRAPMALNCAIIDDQLKIQAYQRRTDVLCGIESILSLWKWIYHCFFLAGNLKLGKSWKITRKWLNEPMG